MSKMFFNVFAEFEADPLKMRTREGMAIARSRGKLKGKQPGAVGAGESLVEVDTILGHAETGEDRGKVAVR